MRFNEGRVAWVGIAAFLANPRKLLLLVADTPLPLGVCWNRHSSSDTPPPPSHHIIVIMLPMITRQYSPVSISIHQYPHWFHV